MTVQLILILPILLIATIAIIELGFIATLRQAVHHAATVAAREAAKGASFDDVVEAVDVVLFPHNLQVGVGDCVAVTLEDPERDPQQAGNFTCTPPTEPELSGPVVRVTVCVDLTNHPLGNTLAVVGISTVGKTLTASSVVPKELP